MCEKVVADKMFEKMIADQIFEKVVAGQMFEKVIADKVSEKVPERVRFAGFRVLSPFHMCFAWALLIKPRGLA